MMNDKLLPIQKKKKHSWCIHVKIVRFFMFQLNQKKKNLKKHENTLVSIDSFSPSEYWRVCIFNRG